jgi:hypothetical protein
MAGNIVPVVPVAEGQVLVMWNGVFQPNVVEVKLPKQEHGEVVVHPLGRAAPIKSADGTVEWDDLELTFAMGEGIPVAPLLLWYLSVVDPKTSLGNVALANNQTIQVIDQNNAGLPMVTHVALVWPKVLDAGKREGGSKDARKLMTAFSVNHYEMLPTL